MNVNEFYRQLKHNLNFVTFNSEFIIYKNHKGPKKTFELYDIFTRESLYLPWDELLKYEVKGKTVESYVEDLKDLNIRLDGGNGQSSASHKVFGGGGVGGGTLHPDFPSRVNNPFDGNRMSQAHTLEVFRQKHIKSGREHLMIMDDNGFVSVYGHGGRSSVGVPSDKAAGKHVVHNHPAHGYSHFSEADLTTFSSTRMKSITATSTEATYKVTKTDKFDANGFSKAIVNAKTTSTDYNTGVHNFLTKASKKYGFIYERVVH